MSQSSASLSSSSAVFQVGMLSKFLDQWRSITSNKIVLNMVWSHCLQLRSWPSLFCNFCQFIVKVAAAPHPTIQKKVDELLSKGAIEPSSGGAGFYSSVLFLSIVVASGPYLTLGSLIIICINLLLRCLL